MPVEERRSWREYVACLLPSGTQEQRSTDSPPSGVPSDSTLNPAAADTKASQEIVPSVCPVAADSRAAKPKKADRGKALTKAIPQLGKSKHAATSTGRCPLMHGTVYADPFPGYVHGTHPEICEHGCCPVLQSALGETPLEKLKREADEFVKLYHHEAGLSDDVRKKRADEIQASIKATGTYEHTFDELQWGIRAAWRNASKCANRRFWSEIMLIDYRHANTTEEMFKGCKELLERATAHRATVPYLVAFKPQTPGQVDGPRVWNSQLLRFACYEQPDGTLLGDPANKDITRYIIDEMGWQPPSPRGAFDVLPLLLQTSPGLPPRMYEYPAWYVSLVNLKHPDLPWFAEMNLKWYAIPVVSAMELLLGGLRYTACPFSGWYADTEVVRDLTDECRYDLVATIGAKMGLDMRSDATLWKDTVMHAVTIAVNSSFKDAGFGMVDHHTLINGFWAWYWKELKTRGYCPGNWKWIIPPLNPTLSKCYLGLNKMTEYTLLPAYVYAPNFKHFVQLLGKASVANVQELTAAREVVVDSTVSKASIAIVYGSVTGNTKRFAYRLAVLLGDAFKVNVMASDEYSLEQIKEAAAVIQLTCTYGSGAAPTSARKYLVFLGTPEAAEILKDKPVATLGFGSTQYPRFCAAAELFSQVMAATDAVNMLRIGKCDGNMGEESDFRGWAGDLFTQLNKRELLSDADLVPLLDRVSIKNAKTDLSPVFNVIPAPNLRKVATDTTRFQASVKETVQLLASAAPNRSTVRVTLDLKHLPYLQYLPGDHLVVYPRNEVKVVEEFSQKLGIKDLDVPFFLEKLNANEPDPFPSPITYRTAITDYMDLNAKPSPAALAVFASLLTTADPHSASELAALAADSAEYQGWLETVNPRWRDIFSLYPALEGLLPVERLFELCQPTAPRYYSISSAMSRDGASVTVTVGMLNYFLTDGRHRRGMASSYLTQLAVGDVVSFSIAAAPAFYMPMNSNCPMLLVAAGTGIAPFRSFWAEREMRVKVVGDLAPCVVIFGCRSLSSDCLYLQEMERAKACGALSDVIYCLSREEGVPKMYVQDCILKNSERIKTLLGGSDAHYFICGDIRMASSCAASLKKVLGADTVAAMQGEGRWHEDIFGSSKAPDQSKDAAASQATQLTRFEAMKMQLKIDDLIRAMRNSPASVRDLLPSMGAAELGWADEDGRTLVHMAVIEDVPDDILELLVTATGTLGTADAFSLTPLALARTLGRGNAIATLRKLNAPLLSSMQKSFFPIHSAIITLDSGAIERALKAKVNTNKVDSCGNNLLHCAVAINSLEMVKILLAGGAQVNRPNSAGRNASQIAALLGLTDILAFLKRNGGLLSMGQAKTGNFDAGASEGALESAGGPFTRAQIDAIQLSWGYLKKSEFPEQTKEHLTEWGVQMFRCLFDSDPRLLKIFPFKDASGQPLLPALKEHALKVITEFDVLIDMLDDVPALVARIDALARMHLKYGVRQSHYVSLTSALIATVESTLGEAWSDEQLDAWNSLMEALKAVAAGAYKPALDPAAKPAPPADAPAAEAAPAAADGDLAADSAEDSGGLSAMALPLPPGVALLE